MNKMILIFLLLFFIACQQQKDLVGQEINRASTPHEEKKMECRDSDGGNYLWDKGKTVMGTQEFEDTCTGDILSEFVCEPDQIKKQDYACASIGLICRSGACVDKDNVEGTCVIGGGTYDNNTYEKSVYHTNNDGMKYTKLACLQNFFNMVLEGNNFPCGKHVADNRPIISYRNVEWFTDLNEKSILWEDFCGFEVLDHTECIDSEIPSSVTISGWVEQVGVRYEDKCKDENTLIEYYCFNNKIQTELIDCSQNYNSCMDGACRGGETSNTISSCRKTLREKGIYHLEQNLDFSDNEPCILIDGNEIIIDCQGHTISGKYPEDQDHTQYGIKIGKNQKPKNVEIHNCVFSNLVYGIYVDSAAHALIESNEFKSTVEAIYFGPFTENSNISANNIHNNDRYGINAFGAKHLVIQGNTITHNDAGIYISSDSVTVKNNTIHDNTKEGILAYANPNIISNSLQGNRVGLRCAQDYRPDVRDNTCDNILNCKDCANCGAFCGS